MATADKEAMERGGGGFRVGEAEDPVSTVSVGGEGDGCRAGVLTHHEGGLRWSRESAPRGQGRGRGRRGGGPRPALDCTFSFLLFLFSFLAGEGGVFPFLLVFLAVGMRGPL